MSKWKQAKQKDGVEGSWMTDELSDIADPSSHECSSAAAAAAAAA